MPITDTEVDRPMPFVVVSSPKSEEQNKSQEDHPTYYMQGMNEGKYEGHAKDLGGTVRRGEMLFPQVAHTDRLRHQERQATPPTEEQELAELSLPLESNVRQRPLQDPAIDQ